ncbi:response regulator, partial [Cupriavidus sp. UBA2534]
MNAMQPTVCIVDDDDSVRRALARVLGAHRYHTSCFDSAKRFLDNVELENSPICAVVDLQMPDMDG